MEIERQQIGNKVVISAKNVRRLQESGGAIETNSEIGMGSGARYCL